jgi:hypothetical protein
MAIVKMVHTEGQNKANLRDCYDRRELQSLIPLGSGSDLGMRSYDALDSN